jgi:hypothetical protein
LTGPFKSVRFEPPQILTKTLVFFRIMKIMRHSDAKLGGKHTLNDN